MQIFGMGIPTFSRILEYSLPITPIIEKKTTPQDQLFSCMQHAVMFCNDCIFHFLSLEGNNPFLKIFSILSIHSSTLSVFHRTGSCFLHIQTSSPREFQEERLLIKQKVAERDKFQFKQKYLLQSSRKYHQSRLSLTLPRVVRHFI